MKRLYTYTDGPAQGAVPRDFNSPEECLPVDVQPPVDPPGCPDWALQTNTYGRLPKSWARSVEYGDLYNSFFGTVNFTADNEWTDLWSSLSTAQQNQIFEEGCFCDDDGITTPTLVVGPLQFPPVNTLPFFWIPPPVNQQVSAVRDKNPVNMVPGNCCDHSKAQLDMNVSAGGEISAEVTMEKEPERRYRSTYIDDRFLMQNGFPRWCCDEDECDPEKQIYKWQHLTRWLADQLDPYDAGNPKEPVGVFPFVMDFHYNRDNGVAKFSISQAIIHDGNVYDVAWDLDNQPSDGTAAPRQPLVSLPYNQDWDGQALIDIQKIGDPCANQCKELNIGACDLECQADKYDGYALDGTESAVAASEQDAIDSALEAARDEASQFGFAELCYSRKQTQAEGGQYLAVAGVYEQD